MVIKFLEQFVLDRAGARAAGPLRRRGRLLLRPARVPVGRVDPGEGADDLRACSRCSRPWRCRPRPSRPPSRLGKRFARLRAEPGRRRGGDARVGRVREVGDERTRAPLGDRPGASSGRRCAEFFDEAAFLSPHGLRAVSKRYENNPYTLEGVDGRLDRLRAGRVDDDACSAATRTGAARSGCRVNYLAIRQFVIYQRFFGDDFKLEYPTGSGQQRTLRRDRPGPRRPAHLDLAARTATAAGRSTAAPSGSRPTRPGRTTCSSTSTSTATTAPASARRTRPAGRRSSPT